MAVRKVEDMEVFKKAHKLALGLYKITNTLPSHEKFGLSSQIQRAAVSINSNLMEGSHRNNSKEFRQFAGIARGSCGELKYQVLMLKDLEYISVEDYKHFSAELEAISRMLSKLIAALAE